MKPKSTTRKTIAPRILDEHAAWYGENFRNKTSGAEFMLEALPDLYKKTLNEIQGVFTAPELKLIIDVFNGYAPNAHMMGQSLWWSVTEGIKYDALDVKWCIDKEVMQKKIDNLCIFQCAALEIWANGFWYGGTDENAGRELDVEARIKQLLKEA